MKEAGVHVGHDIVTIAGDRAGTMLLQLTDHPCMPWLVLGESQGVAWPVVVVTKAQICVFLICKSGNKRASYFGCLHLHKGDTKEATYHPSLRAKRESEGVALGGGHWPPISAATQARQGRQAEVKLLQPFADKNTGHTDTH